MKEKIDILILCRVVDNFGDIGVVFRLARRISHFRPDLRIAICASDLRSFKMLCPQIDENAQIQEFNNWKIVCWNGNGEISNMFKKNPPKTILECFQCGRPDWLEEILFSADFAGEAHIVNIDYLTAEDWADDFHLLKSGTRSAKIRKTIFMPGFSQKTGGLLLDDFGENKKNPDSIFKILIFSYERDFLQIVRAINDFSKNQKTKIFLAKSKNAEPFLDACKKIDVHFEIEELPFLPQSDFDSLINEMDFLFVRGEDSMARACLAGVPFVWHAYKQKDDWQIVKADALLQKIKPFFAENQAFFKKLSLFWRNYNGEKNGIDEEKTLFEILESAKNVAGDFERFADSLKKNGDLAENLIRFLEEKNLI